MDQGVRDRLRVIGEMAESYLPPGFYNEVLELVDKLPPEAAVQVLTTHDAYLQNAKRYSDVARKCYLDLMNVLQGSGPAHPALSRLDYLVEASELTYPEDQVQPVRDALFGAQVALDSDFELEDKFKRLVKALNKLVFFMDDSPSYPSEREVRFYVQLVGAGVLASLPLSYTAARVICHTETLLEEHAALLARSNGAQ